MFFLARHRTQSGNSDSSSTRVRTISNSSFEKDEDTVNTEDDVKIVTRSLDPCSKFLFLTV